jgi:hypothetical protein
MLVHEKGYAITRSGDMSAGLMRHSTDGLAAFTAHLAAAATTLAKS